MGRAGIACPKREARAMYAGLGAGLLELFWLAGATPSRREETLRTQVILDDDLDLAIRNAAARGPLILLASHTGNWELLGYGTARVLAAARGSRLVVVAKALSVGSFHAFCTKLREACGFVLLAPEGALTAARRSLAAGDVVVMPIDQVPDRAKHGVSVSFLGAPALADRAPAVLAFATGATLILVGGSRDGRLQRGHLLTELRPPTAAADRLTAAEWVAHATCEATRALDTFVRAHPSSWLWLHRRWRAPLELRSTPTAAALVATGQPG